MPEPIDGGHDTTGECVYYLPPSALELANALYHRDPEENYLVSLDDVPDGVRSFLRRLPADPMHVSLAPLAVTREREMFYFRSTDSNLLRDESLFSSALFWLAPIHLAALHGNTETVKMLLDRGAHLQAVGAIHLPAIPYESFSQREDVQTFVCTALELAICHPRARSEPVDTAMFLLGQSFSVSPLASPEESCRIHHAFDVACGSGRLDIVQAVIDRRRNEGSLEDLTIPWPDEDYSPILGNELLFAISRNQYWDVLRCLSETVKAFDYLKQQVSIELPRLVWALLREDGFSPGSWLRVHETFNIPESDWKAACILHICLAVKDAHAHQDGVTFKEHLLFVLDLFLSDCRPEHFMPMGLCTMALGRAVQQYLMCRCDRELDLMGALIVKIMKKGASFHLPIVKAEPSSIQAPSEHGGDSGPVGVSRAVGQSYSTICTALCTLVAGPRGPGALPRFQKMLADSPPLQEAPDQDSYSSDNDCFHQLMTFWIGPLHFDKSLENIPLATLARQLILSGWDAEEKHRRTGDTVLMHLLKHLRDRKVRAPSPLETPLHPFCVDDIILVLACLQHCGAKLETTNDELATPEMVLQSLGVPTWPEDKNSGEPLPVSRAAEKISYDSMMQRLPRVIQVCNTADGTKMMRFHRPRAVPRKDLPGDEGFFKELLGDDRIWLFCRCNDRKGAPCMGDWCMTGWRMTSWRNDHDAVGLRDYSLESRTYSSDCAWSLLNKRY